MAGMRATFCLIGLCIFVAGCSHNGEPSAAQIEAAINREFKAKNPDAIAKVLSTDIQRPYCYKEFTFSCTNCVVQDEDGLRHVLPSAKGHGMVTLSARLQKWKFDRIILESEEFGLESYKSDFIF
jgi:hypothetical protein